MDGFTAMGDKIVPYQGPTPLQNMSSVMGLAQQRQALETAAAGTIQAKQAARETQAAAQLLSDPVGNGVIDGDGNPTKDAQSIIMRTMPTTGSERYGQILTAAKSKLEFNTARDSLSNAERQTVYSTAAGLAAGADSPDVVKKGLEALVSDKQGTPEQKHYRTIVDTLNGMATHVADKEAAATVKPEPGKEAWRTAYLNGGRAVLGAGATVGAGGIAAPGAGQMDTGAAIQPGVVAPALQGGGFTPSGAPIPKAIPPQAQIVTDANGRQFRYNPQGNRLEPLGAGGGGAAPAAPNGPAGPKFTQPIPGQENAQKEIETTRAADTDYGLNRHLNGTILRLSKTTDTGPGTDYWHHALGAIAGPAGGNNIADYQTIGAMLDRQAALATRQMGLPETNAGIQTAQSLSGNKTYQPEALQTKVKLTDALIEGSHKYRVGLDKVIGIGPNQDLSKYQAYRAAWAANFDPTVFALDNAHNRDDKEEVASVLKGVSPKQAALLQQKAKNLRLLENGVIPQ